MHFSCPSRLLLALTCTFGSGIAVTVPAHAQLTVTLDQPNQFYDTSSGVKMLMFTGTVQNNTADAQSIQDYNVRYPYNHMGQPLSNARNNPIGFGSEPFQFAPGASYSGELFSATLDSTTAPGVYDLAIGSGSIPDIACYFQAQAQDAVTGTFSYPLSDFSITVTSPAAVPEASTTVSFGLLLVLGGAAAVVKRKKAAAV